MFWSKLHAVDDRARSVELITLNAGAFRDDPDLASTVGRIHESIWNNGRLLSLQRLLPVLMGVVVGASSFAVIGLMRTSVPPWTVMIVVWVLVFAGIRTFMQFTRRKHTGRIVESLLRIGRCPGCGYDLRACTPESDGVCVCPECSAAWRQGHIGHAPVPRGDQPILPDSPGDTPSVLAIWKRVLRRTPTIVDDRNRSVPRVGMDLPGIERDIGEEGALELRRSVARATALRRYGCAVPIALIGLLVVLGSGFTFFRTGAGLFSLIALAFAVWMVVVYSTICWRMLTGRLAGSSGAVVKRLRLARVCPSCAAFLRAGVPEPDGCKVCPRCNAAWRFEAIPEPTEAPGAQDSTRNTTSV